MPKGQPTSAETIAKIREMRSQGANVVAIATALGVSTKSVVRYTSPAVQDRESAREHILKTVAEQGPFATVHDLMAVTNSVTDGHNMIHLLFALNQSGLITFRETKSGGGQTRPERITVTKRGLEHVGLPARPINGEVGHGSSHLPPMHGKGDMTDFRNLPSRALGGPITKFPSPSGVAGGTFAHPRPDISADIKHYHAPITEPQPEPVAVEPVVVSEPYPLIKALVERRSKIEVAAKALEQAGLDDLALTALAQIDNFTPLEREAIALYEAHTNG